MRQYVKHIASIVCVLVFSLFLLGSASTGPTISPMQQRQITTRMIDGNYENTYRAVMTVLQDQGYILKNTDMASGLIVATMDRETSGGSQFAQAFFFGYVSDKGTVIEATCTVSKLSDTKSDLRIMIQETNYGQSSAWSGSGKQGVKTIYDEKIYKALFDQILVEVKRREAING